MSDHGFETENIMAAFPPVLTRDRSITALGRVMASAMVRLMGETDLTRIYANIGALPEALLDILAYDFKIDWWDPNYPVETKRALFQDGWRVHRLLGTPEAVNLVIRAVFGEGRMTDWYEYGGEPYHFRVEANNTGVAGDDWIGYFMRLLATVKRLTSCLDGITVSTQMPEDTVHLGGAAASVTRLSIPAG